jgi:hypothetical protein
MGTMRGSMAKKKRRAKQAPKQPPPEIIAICERPSYLEHIKTVNNEKIRITVEISNGKGWKQLTSDEGVEIWLLEYPPHSCMAHYCLKGVKAERPVEQQWRSIATDDDVPF